MNKIKSAKLKLDNGREVLVRVDRIISIVLDDRYVNMMDNVQIGPVEQECLNNLLEHFYDVLGGKEYKLRIPSESADKASLDFFLQSDEN